MARNFYTYLSTDNQKLHGYQRKYKKHSLRKRGFSTKGAAESDLRQAMDAIDASIRGETKFTPTTVQDAYDIYHRKLFVRANDKGFKYTSNATGLCKVLLEFVNHFGPDRLLREVTETDLREFHQLLCFRMTRNSANTYLGFIQGMFGAAQKAKADLVSWPRPTLRVKRETEYERRVVEPAEYATLVQALRTPPPQLKTQSGALWREAADAVQLLRLTGGRVNEVLSMKLDQVVWSKGILILLSTKTESERKIPLSVGVRKLVSERIREGLTEDLLFPRAVSVRFDQYIGRAVRAAAKRSGLAYGRAQGFTLHSFRHTFITDLMLKTKGDIRTVMQLSGHKSLASFSTYIHPQPEGWELAIQCLDSVAPFLPLSPVPAVPQGLEGLTIEEVKSLQEKQVAVSG